MVRIVSLNVWGGQAYQPLMRFLSSCKADIFCLQEVHDAPVSNARTVKDNRGGEVQIKLYEELEKSLLDYRGSHHPFAYRFLNDGETTEHPVGYGIATFIRKSLRVIGQRTDFIFGSYRAAPEGSAPLPRNMHCFRVHDPEAGTSLTVAHFHGLWKRNGAGSSDRRTCAERREQTDRIVQMLRSFVHEGEKLVLCGDMNVLPSSAMFDVLRRELRMTELVTDYGFPSTRTSMCKKIEDLHADYLLISPEVSVQAFEVPAEPEVSDHRPLILDCS